jgi:nicotinate dehydrogenase subunit B
MKNGTLTNTVISNGGFPLTRRTFLKTFGGGLAVLWFVPKALRAQNESGAVGTRRGTRRPRELAAWLHIDAKGAVTVYTGKAEVGQNIRTSLTQAVAEELGAPVATITLVMADTSLVPWDAGTFGSRTTPDMNLQLRKVAATARAALADLAAKRWGVERNAVATAEGKIVHTSSGRSFGFGELTAGEKLVADVADDVKLKLAAEWKIAGTSVLKVNGRDFVTGRHAYAIDGFGSARTDLLHGRVLRPPTFHATLVSIDTTAAEAMPGVRVVREGEFVGVTAPTEQLAAGGVAAIRADWKTSPQVSERELIEHLRSTARDAPAASAAANSTSLSDAATELRQTYTAAYIAHVPLEPRAAVAEWKNDQLTVWTGSQRPFGVRAELARTLSLPEEKIRVVVPDTGSGYGGKHTGETAIEAAWLAKAAGRPVRLAWTREEEFTWAYFRPAAVIDITSTLGTDGTIATWEHHNYNSGNAGLLPPYDVPLPRTAFHASDSPLRQGSYRALAATANNFARETHVDELAHTAHIDPVEFRLKNLKDPRARAVLEAAAQRFGWTQSIRRDSRGENRGIGVAIGHEKGGYLATCAEVLIDRSNGRVTVRRVVQAFECGAVVNPEHLRNQNEGAIVQGLGGGLFEAVHFENGRILNPRLSRYRVPRFSDTPAIDVVLVDRKDLPSAGAGECPIIGIAPAVGNAIFDATGIRLRSLPLVPSGLKV